MQPNQTAGANLGRWSKVRQEFESEMENANTHLEKRLGE